MGNNSKPHAPTGRPKLPRDGLESTTGKLGSGVFRALCYGVLLLVLFFFIIQFLALQAFIEDDPVVFLFAHSTTYRLFFIALGITIQVIFAAVVVLVLRRWLRARKALALLPDTSAAVVEHNPVETTPLRGVTAKGYALLCAWLTLGGLATIVLHENAERYAAVLWNHALLGVVAFLVLPFVLYVQARKATTRGRALLLAIYPLFIPASLLTPSPLLLVLLLDVSFVPILLLVLITAKRHRDDLPGAIAWLSLLCLLTITVATGLYAVMDPTNLRFAFQLRKFHGFYAFWSLYWIAILLGAAWVRRRRSARSSVSAAPISRVVAGIALAGVLGFASWTSVRAYKIGRLEEGYRQRTYVNAPLGKKVSGIHDATLPVDELNRSAECKVCHPVPHEQWARSTHAYAARNTSFQTVLRSLVERHGAEIAADCASCHDPAVSLSGDPSLLYDDEYLKTSDGVGCRGCHYMSHAGMENAQYTIEIPRTDALFATAAQRRAFITASTLEHVRDNSRDIVRDGTICYPCHRIVNRRDGKTVVPLDNVTSFLESPHAQVVKCHHCHMPRLVTDHREYSWQDHGFFGANMHLGLIAMTPDQDAHAEVERLSRETSLFLAGEEVLPRVGFFSTMLDETVKSYRVFNYGRAVSKLRAIRRVLDAPSHFSINLERAELPDWERSHDLDLEVSVTNLTIGHDFPSSLFANIQDIGLDLEVCDSSGAKVAEANHRRDRAHRLGRLEVDAKGRPIFPYESLSYVDIVDEKFLKPRVKYHHRFSVVLPPSTSLPLKAVVKLSYRRYNDHHVQWFSKGSVQTIKERILAEAEFQLP